MKPSEAQDLTSLLRAAFSTLDDDTCSLFQRMLVKHDADIASRAILRGINQWHYPPKWADVLDMIRFERGPETHAPPPALKASGLQMWVRRWVCARFLFARFDRDQDTRPFREQFPNGVPDGVVCMDDTDWLEEANTVDIADAWKAIRHNTGGAA